MNLHWTLRNTKLKFGRNFREIQEKVMLQNAKLELFLTTVAVLIIMLKYLLVVEQNCALNLHYQNPFKNLIFQT